MKVKVKFDGFLQSIEREFSTIEMAETWLRKIGKWGIFGPAWGVNISPVD
jgi:hypothetical protein